MTAALTVRMPAACQCGSNLATIGPGDGKFAAGVLACQQCGGTRGAIGAFTKHFIEALASRFGTPETIVLRSSAIVREGSSNFHEAILKKGI